MEAEGERRNSISPQIVWSTEDGGKMSDLQALREPLTGPEKEFLQYVEDNELSKVEEIFKACISLYFWNICIYLACFFFSFLLFLNFWFWCVPRATLGINKS